MCVVLEGNQFLFVCDKKNMSNSDQLPIYFKSYQLVKFLYERIRNFPKEYRYTLGEEILRLSWQCIDLIIDVNILSNEKKYFKISELSTNFDKLKTRLRLAQEINLISVKQFAHIQTYYIKEVGEMIGGWLNWSFSQR